MNITINGSPRQTTTNAPGAPKTDSLQMSAKGMAQAGARTKPIKTAPDPCIMSHSLSDLGSAPLNTDSLVFVC